jgi:hypothetical protein
MINYDWIVMEKGKEDQFFRNRVIPRYDSIECWVY